MGKIFGTDGIRGPANLYPMTSEVALTLDRAIIYQVRNRSVIMITVATAARIDHKTGY